MKVPLWASELADGFWKAAGGPEPFPRALRGPIIRSEFDLTVKELPGLNGRSAERYLAGLDVTWACGSPARPLRACLVASAGAGFIFLDAADPPREQAFSLAHEVAHFLRHYLEPRRRACRRLGEQVLAVLDGARPPTEGERVHALLRGVPIGCHVHLMGRGPRREALTGEVAVAEEEADRLAYELLAPAAAVSARLGEVEGEAGRARAVEVLRAVFGLPAAQAEEYGRLLLPPLPEDPLLGRLRKT